MDRVHSRFSGIDPSRPGDEGREMGGVGEGRRDGRLPRSATERRGIHGITLEPSSATKPSPPSSPAVAKSQGGEEEGHMGDGARNSKWDLWEMSGIIDSIDERTLEERSALTRA